jgi:putative colanic acid biosynthesis acetyltransferase WcaF
LPTGKSVGETPATQVPEPKRRVFVPQTFRQAASAVLWSAIWRLVFRWSPPAFHFWRVMLLRLFGAEVHRSARISPSVRIHSPWNLRVRKDVVIAHKAIFNCIGTIEIGDRTRISQYAHLCAGSHDYRRRDMPIIRCPITIGRDVWVAADAFVGPGVTIGDGCVLAARSAAFHDLPPGQVCMGEPARPRHARFGEKHPCVAPATSQAVAAESPTGSR